MNSDELEAHAGLWTSGTKKYRLILSNGEDLEDGAVVFDAVSGGPLLIDVSDAAYKGICKKMLGAGVETISAGQAAAFGDEALLRMLGEVETVSRAKDTD